MAHYVHFRQLMRLKMRASLGWTRHEYLNLQRLKEDIQKLDPRQGMLLVEDDAVVSRLVCLSQANQDNQHR